jgi:hypothetical protein
MNRVMIFEASLGGSSARCEKPIVSIVSPNGNESYVGGSTQTLSYGYTSCAVSDVSVSLITEDGSAIPISLSDATRDISTGSLHWVVPSISTTHARLKISLLGSQGQVLATDESDADFTITTDQIGGVIEDEETSSDTLTALDLFKAEVSPLSINENFGFSNEAPESPLCISNTLIKDPVNAAVYYCGADGKRHVFVNAKVFYSWYSSFGSVITLSSETLNAIPVGENVAYRPRQRMIKLQSDAKVYAVSGGGVLHLIANEVIAEALYGKDWNTMIDDIADAFFVNYTAGAPLE